MAGSGVTQRVRPPAWPVVPGPRTPGAKFTRYAVCKATKDRIRDVNQQYRVIILNAANLGSCPIYVWDDKGSPGTKCFPGPHCKPQQYTFTINLAKGALDNCTKDPTSCPFTFFADPENANGIKAPRIQWWANPPPPPAQGELPPPGSTSNLIVCTGNRAGPSGHPVCTDLGCYYPSSQNWCCTSPIASYGVFADSVPITDAHKTLQFNVTTRPPEACTQWGSDQPQPCTVAVQACSSGIPIGPVAQPTARGLLTGKSIGPVAQPPGRGVLSRP